jgi:glycosyltransferase involved in cell wall biosynthesis
VNILVLSAYDAESHRRWHQGMVACLPFNFTVLTLPARNFSWRIRGNALTWALGNRSALTAKKWDIIIATSMVDLATLKGLLPEWALIPSIVYFHENQFVFPLTRFAHPGIEPQMVTLFSALAASKIVFNSAYNKNTFLDGVHELLKKMPDHVPNNIVTLINEKSTVLPVPIEQCYFDLKKKRNSIGNGEHNNPRPLQILWNHRWEYDKGPDRLLEIIRFLANNFSNLSLCWNIVGQQFRKLPAEFSAIKALLEEKKWLGHWGYLPLADYQHVLQNSDIALATSIHEFQGLAVLEAVAAGCIPLVPNRLAYPEFFDKAFLYRVSHHKDEIEEEAHDAAQKIVAYSTFLSGRLIAPDVSGLSWVNLGPDYAHFIRALNLRN